MAIEKLEAVSSVETNMSNNTVTVAFDDSGATIHDVVNALRDAGYVVRRYLEQSPPPGNGR